MTDHETRVEAMAKIAADTAIEKAQSHPGKIFLVIALDFDETGYSAYGIGVGHPANVEVDSMVVLKTALNNLAASIEKKTSSESPSEPN
jgi:hypothetical protein